MIVTDTLLRETRLRFPELEAEQVKITSIEKGGSERKFYRVQFAPGNSIVLVKYEPGETENQRYVEIAEFLATHKIRAPEIYFHDPAKGLIWLEDLGERDLWSYREESWEIRRPLYESALVEVAKLHRVTAADSAEIKRDLPAQFDAALYLWEQSYFFEQCLGRRFGMPAEKWRALAELPALRSIAEQLASYPRVLVHRDFQSQNIILREEKACLIDFQGMRPGLGEYDLASLLYDPYVRLTSKEHQELSDFYQARAEIADSAFTERLRLCAMQRLMQALGAFGYLGLVRQRQEFLGHIPAALYSLGEIVAGIGGLEELQRELTHLSPRG
ncbi:MAG: phosphotransferase [Chthoniobacterales bacterium]|nr:phosphotransferase [Chthoniobacterales bacterium]